MKSLSLRISESLERRGLKQDGVVVNEISATELYAIAKECRCEVIEVMTYIRYGKIF